MPGKFTEGYTKSEQKKKFVRHRDLKMKDSELRKERHIQKLMGEGVCQKCREKLQWRFQFDKYKPLKNPATCQECKQKTIVKAYRTFCDPCGQLKNVCPGCCEDLDAIAAAEATRPQPKRSAEEAELDAPSMTPLAAAQDADQVDMEDDDDSHPSGRGAREMQVDEGAEEDEEEEEEEKEEGGEDEGDEQAQVEIEEDAIPTSAAAAMQWNEQKFRNISANKYSKNRVTGQEL